MNNRALSFGGALLALDALVVAWVIAWAVAGLRVADEVDGLTELSATVSSTGGAVAETGEALGSLNVPLLGDRVDDVAQEVEQTGRETQASGRTARESISDLSTLLGLAVALIPSSPLLVMYVPMRIARTRERRALRRLIRVAGDDPRLEALLAERARHQLSYRRLAHADARPWQPPDEEQCARLAEAERARLGLTRT